MSIYHHQIKAEQNIKKNLAVVKFKKNKNPLKTKKTLVNHFIINIVKGNTGIAVKQKREKSLNKEE